MLNLDVRSWAAEGRASRSSAAVLSADWPQSDLTDRLFRALAVATRTVDAFAASGYDHPDDPAASVTAEKAVAETAMLLHAAFHASADRQVRARVSEVATMLALQARTETVLLRAALHPSLAEGMAVSHVLLTRLGHPDPRADTVLAACVGSLGSRGHELPPYGVLEKLWIRDLWGVPVAAEAWRQVLQDSGLATPLDFVGGLREDSYAFTHALMYCTDFGARKRQMPRPNSALLADARILLAVCLDGGDYDLAGEVLMAWPFLDEPWCAAANFAFMVLARVEDEAGLLPGGTTNVARLHSYSGDRRQKYALGTAYHTAYVMGMLCAVSLRPGRGPSRNLTGAGIPQAMPSEISDKLVIDQPDVRAVLTQLSDQELDAIAVFRLDLAVAQAVRTQEYGRLADLLRAVHRIGYASPPLGGQAGELLSRLALAVENPSKEVASEAAERDGPQRSGVKAGRN